MDMAIKIDQTVKAVRPDAWRGEKACENVIKAAMYGIVQDKPEVERLFKIIFEQKREY